MQSNANVTDERNVILRSSSRFHYLASGISRIRAASFIIVCCEFLRLCVSVQRYFLGNCCSVITTNKWYEDLKKLPAGDQKWLEANMVVFDVERPLWQNPCMVEDCREAFNALQI